MKVKSCLLSDTFNGLIITKKLSNLEGLMLTFCGANWDGIEVAIIDQDEPKLGERARLAEAFETIYASNKTSDLVLANAFGKNPVSIQLVRPREAEMGKKLVRSVKTKGISFGHITDVSESALNIGKLFLGAPVTFIFNDVHLCARPDDQPKDIAKRYDDIINGASEAQRPNISHTKAAALRS